MLNREIFLSLEEARWVIDRWRADYNHRRPHRALDYQTRAACAVGCIRRVGAGDFSPEPLTEPDLWAYIRLFKSNISKQRELFRGPRGLESLLLGV